MLINAIRGENFMKFRRITLENVPRCGVIGVEGRNEGGKSTVGELLQFAFFGKTTSSRSASVLDLIRWDQDQCAVEVDFEIAGRGSYRVWREIDRYGTNYARLLQLPTPTTSASRHEASVPSSLSSARLGDGSSSDESTRRDRSVPGGTEIAAGTMQVQRELANLLRFSYDDFINSFYLEEQDFPRSPEQMRTYLDRIVGVEVFVRATDEVQREIVDLEEQFAELQSNIKRNLLQVEKYLPNIARIPECEAAREEHTQQLESLRATEREITQRVEAQERVGKEREVLRDRVRGLKDVAPAKLEHSVEQALRGYPENPDGVLASSKRELQKIRDRLTQVRSLGPRRMAVLNTVASTRADLEDELQGKGPDSIPSRRKALEREVEVARSGLARTGTLAFSLLGLAVGLGALAAGVGLRWFGESPLGVDPSQARLTWIISGSVAGLLFLIGVLLLRRRSRFRGTLSSAAEQSQGLETEREALEARLAPLSAIDESVSFDDLPTLAAKIRGDECASALGAYKAQRETALAGSASLGDLFATLADEENKVVQRLRSTTKEDKKELQQNLEAQKRELSKRDRAEGEIREFQKQDGKRLTLEEQNQQVREQSDRVREDIETRQLTLQLFQETMDSVRQRTGPALGRAMRRLVPHVTAGRYTDLKITPDFRLQIFTREKSDFLAPQELSGGTFEGLSFGFRLAFSQAFIRAVVRQPQFLFLDEPFKAMDRDRVHCTLAVLPRLSEDMPQVFVVLPGIAEADRPLFDAIVTAKVGETELRFAGGTTAVVAPELESPGSEDVPPARDVERPRADGRSETPASERTQLEPPEPGDAWERMLAERQPRVADDGDSAPSP